MPKSGKAKKMGRPEVPKAKRKVAKSVTWAPQLLSDFDDFLRDLWGTNKLAVDRSRGVCAAITLVMENPAVQKLYVEKLKV